MTWYVVGSVCGRMGGGAPYTHYKVLPLSDKLESQNQVPEHILLLFPGALMGSLADLRILHSPLFIIISDY